MFEKLFAKLMKYRLLFRELYNITFLLVCPYYVWRYIAREAPESQYIIYNLLLIYILELSIFFLIRSAWGASVLTVLATYILYIANDIVTQLRGIPLSAGDIFSLKTAMSVATDYANKLDFSYEMGKRTKWCLVWIVLTSIAVLVIRKIITNKKGRITERLVALAVLVCCCFTLQRVDLSQWDMQIFWHNSEIATHGYALCFYKEIKELSLKPPSSYSKKEVEEFLDEYSSDKVGNTPDVIVIMNEAWGNFSYLDESYLNADYMPYIHEEVQKGEFRSGKVYVSVFGGNTANTEWEFLTGNSMIFCPNAVPYNQYVIGNIDSVVSHLKENGYTTTAIHPFFASGYSRNQVYQYMGFDEFVSLLDFDDRYDESAFATYISDEEIANSPEGFYIRNKISDEALFQKTIDVYEEKKVDGPVFIFDVTMQNHGAYEYGGYEGEISVDFGEDIPGQENFSQYLSLVRESDRAFEKLIDYYKTVDRDVIILMFGDHQPDIDISIYNKMLGKETGAELNDWTFEEQITRYEVPYG